MSMAEWIDKMFQNAFKKEYYETYWAFDIHGVILEPNHRKNEFVANFYPWAKETMQLISKRPDIKTIMFTSSYPAEIEFYYQVFKNNHIRFDYINENPSIDTMKGNFGYYEKKFYFNVLFEDKAGFNPLVEWEEVYHLMKHYENIGYLPNPEWTTKY